jgi:hypothetical protein
MLPVGRSNGQTNLSVPGSTLALRRPGAAVWADLAPDGTLVGVLRELRSSHGGPHVGTRAIALALALLLALPLTVLLWRAAAWLLGLLV